MPRQIPIQDFDPENQFHTIVREISFGPPLSPTDRHLALFFDIHDSEVRECTEQERKRYKRTNRKLANNKNSDLVSTANPSNISSALPSYAQAASSLSSLIRKNKSTKRSLPTSFDDTSTNINRPFKVIISKDQDCYYLVTQVLQNRLDHLVSLLSLSGNTTAITTSSSFSAFQTKSQLEQKFKSLMGHYSMFHMPVNAGREHVDRTTLVPKPNNKYNLPPSLSTFSAMKRNQYTKGEIVAPHQEHLKENIWESFVQTVSEKDLGHRSYFFVPLLFSINLFTFFFSIRLMLISHKKMEVTRKKVSRIIMIDFLVSTSIMLLVLLQEVTILDVVSSKTLLMIPTVIINIPMIVTFPTMLNSQQKVPTTGQLQSNLYLTLAFRLHLLFLTTIASLYQIKEKKRNSVLLMKMYLEARVVMSCIGPVFSILVNGMRSRLTSTGRRRKMNKRRKRGNKSTPTVPATRVLAAPVVVALPSASFCYHKNDNDSQ